MLPQLARETLRAWHWAKLKLAAGLAAGSLALVFVAVTAGGLLTRHAAPQSVAVNGSPGADLGAVAQTQAVNHLFAPTGNNRTQAFRKTGALTGSVVDDQGHPIPGASVWGGFGAAALCPGYHR